MQKENTHTHTHKSHSKGKPIKITANFSVEILNIRRVYNNAQVLEEHRHQPRLLHPAKLSAKVEGERKYFKKRNSFLQNQVGKTLKNIESKISNEREE